MIFISLGYFVGTYKLLSGMVIIIIIYR